MDKRMICGCLAAALIGFSLTVHAQSEPAPAGQTDQPPSAQGETPRPPVNKKPMNARPRMFASIAGAQENGKVNLMAYAEEQRVIDMLRARLDELQKMADRQMIRSIIQDMQTDKIIDTDKDLWFSLTSKKMIVNGKKQSSGLHKKYAARFLTSPASGIFYGSPNEKED